MVVLEHLSLLWPQSSARGQFVCSTSGNTETCTNAGTSGSFVFTTGAQNATINNSGTVNGAIQDFASAGGNSSTTN